MLLLLLAGTMAFVLWYVRNRRAEMRARPVQVKALGPVAPQPYVDLQRHDAQTIDFSTGRPVVKDSPEDKAALEQGLRDIEEATRNVTFEAEKPAPRKP